MKKFFIELIILSCLSMFVSGQVTISTSQQLVEKLNEIAQQQHMDETLIVAVLDNNEAVLVNHGAIGGSFVITGNVSLRSNYDPEIMNNSYTLEGGSFLVMDEASLKLSSLYANNSSITISGGESTISDVQFSSFGSLASLNVTAGNLTVNRGMFDSVVVSGGEVAISGLNRVNVGSGNVIVNGGTVEITGGKFNSVQLNAGKLHVTGGDIAATIIKGGEPKINGGIFESFEIHADIKKFLEGGKFHKLPSSSEANFTVEDLLAEDYNYYTWDRTFKPDLPFASVKDIAWMNGGVMQVKRKDSEVYTNPIFEEAQKANVGENGTDVKITKLSEATYSPCRYEINTERGLCWLSVIASRYVNYSGNTQFVGAEYNDPLFYYRSEVILKSDLNISDFQWIPIDMPISFDGQGHRITGVKVKEGRAAFFSRAGDVSNLEIIGDFECIEDDYPDVLSYGMAVAGLAVSTLSGGNIVNCGVLNSMVYSSINNIIHGQILMAGLIADNNVDIQNSYAKVDLNYSGTEPIEFTSSAYAGGLTARNSSTLENCYFKGAITTVGQVSKDDLAADNYGQIICCYSQEYATKETLNAGVKDHNSDEHEYTWVEWKDSEGFPTHKFTDDPTVSDGWIYLKKSGEGNFEAKYKILVSENEQQDCIIKADTSVKVNIPKEMVFKISPADGYNFEKLTFVPTNSETESIIEIEKDTVKIEAMAGTYTAYFIPIPVEPDTIVIDSDSTLIPEEVKDQNLVINGGREDEYISLTMSEITVPSLTVKENSHAIFTVSGTNNWGSVINDGTMIIQAEGENSKIVVSSITNNGVFSDETGTITKVAGNASLTVIPMNNQTVDEGETVTLTAEVEASGDVSFQWQKFVENAWVNIKSTPDIQTRTLLRSMQTKKDQLVVSAEDAGQYRCIITCTNGTVSTTLTTFATVIVNTDTNEPEDPDTPPVDPVKYYNIYEESICDGVSLSFSKNPVKEGGSISIKVEKDEENYTFENFKVWYKESYYGNWKELKESTQPGEYKIQNIWTHIYVKAEGSVKKNPTGMEEVEGVKVYTKDGSLFVQTPQREQVIVISMTGAVVKNEEQIGLKQYHGLNPGIYIVRIGNNIYKIRIK